MNDKEAFEKWFKNFWTVSHTKHDCFSGWQAACEYKQKEIDQLKDRLHYEVEMIDGAAKDHIKKLQSENAKLRECVEFYANETSWDDIGGNCLSNVISGSDLEHIIGDTVIGGKRARAVLKETGEIK